MPAVIAPDGLRIVYHLLAAGNNDGRPPVLLQHGFAASTETNWVRVGFAQALADTGRRVIGVDARGHGDSDHPHDPAFYGEAKMAADLDLVIDAVADSGEVDVVGYSMGAVISLILASRSQRIRRLVAGGVGEAVVLYGGVDVREMPPRQLAATLRGERGGPMEMRAFRAFAQHAGADLLALAAQADAVHVSPIPLENITARTLVIAGRSDPLATNPQLLADAIAGAQLRTIEGNHLSATIERTFAPTIVGFLNHEAATDGPRQ